jgi:hypothetical protein
VRRQIPPALSFFVAFLPMTAAVVLVQATEPFPKHWLDPSNDHFAANLLRAISFFCGGVLIGVVCYTMWRAILSENSVTGGHPRRKLYQHIIALACGTGLMIVSVLFYIRERINFGLSPATPVVLASFVLTFYGLGRMIAYQNSRLRSFHAAKQIIGVIEPSDEEGHDLCVKALGSTEPVALRDWVSEFEGGVIARMTIEKVEEVGSLRERRWKRWRKED